MDSPARIRPLGAALCIAVLLGIAGGIVAFEPWHGAVVLSLSAGHGIDAADTPAILFVALAIAVARGRFVRPPRSMPAPAFVLGTLLLLAGVVAKAGGGPLVPAFGGTFDGTIRQTSGTNPVPVGRWSSVAATYDGAVLRLYVNGSQVASRPTTGAIQTPRNPVWIGGNRPYGEYFRGLIDEVRIYDRALSSDEIRKDMAMPVRPAAGLVAAYTFDAGSGTTAADGSGEGNAAEIRRATWAHGRYGRALSFDGDGAVVRVPASATLDLTTAMTLSAWIHPSAPQTGWRTVIQRQTDAYLLTAGSDRLNRLGLLDDVRVALLAGAALWFCVGVATGWSPRTATRRRWWWVPAALFTLGVLADAAFAPSGTLIGPALVALWLAATGSRATERAGFVVATAVCAGLTVASLAHIAGADVALARDDGGIARSAALGALFVIAGLAATRRLRSSPGFAAGPR